MTGDDAATLRRKAETCLRLIRSVTDNRTLEALRNLADELQAQADALDGKTPQSMPCVAPRACEASPQETSSRRQTPDQEIERTDIASGESSAAASSLPAAPDVAAVAPSWAPAPAAVAPPLAPAADTGDALLASEQWLAGLRRLKQEHLA